MSFLLAAAALLKLARLPEGTAALDKTLLPWIVSGSFASPDAFSLDRLSAVMALVVTGVGFLIHVYSTGYMAEDRSFARYFAHLNLFTFFMLVLVLASDIVLMFVGWEGVGLCSYLLIGFWFDRPSASRAGMKAFVVNRVGDAAFIIGILFLGTNVGSSGLSATNAAAAGGLMAPGLVTLAAVLLFVGATGKSAQIPLYVWLPDAMEGPTPVSALWQFSQTIGYAAGFAVWLAGLFARWHDWQSVVVDVCVNDVATHTGYVWQFEQIVGYAAGLAV